MKTTIALLMTCFATLTLPAAPPKYLGSIWQQETAKPWQPDDLLGTFFDQVTAENCGKWGVLEPTRGTKRWEPLDAMVAHGREHRMTIKYHCLVWGMQQPDWTRATNGMREAVDALMGDVFKRYGRSVAFIDVVNEPLTQLPTYRDQLGGSGTTGWDWVLWCFRRARFHAQAGDSSAKLLLNEWGVLEDDAKAKRFIEIAKLLQKERLVDGIGAQAHFPPGIRPEDVRRRLDLLAETGLPIHISEFDYDISDDLRHKNAFSAMFPVFWEHPAVRGVTVWGHREGSIWRKNGYLIRKDGTDRMAMTWLRDYLLAHGRKTGTPPAAKAQPQGPRP